MDVMVRGGKIKLHTFQQSLWKTIEKSFIECLRSMRISEVINLQREVVEDSKRSCKSECAIQEEQRITKVPRVNVVE